MLRVLTFSQQLVSFFPVCLPTCLPLLSVCVCSFLSICFHTYLLFILFMCVQKNLELEKKMSYGTGMTLLFWGPSGTGQSLRQSLGRLEGGVFLQYNEGERVGSGKLVCSSILLLSLKNFDFWFVKLPWTRSVQARRCWQMPLRVVWGKRFC